MILLIAFAALLVLALVATQLKLRAIADQYAAEKVRNDAQRAQFERETRVFQTECEAAAAESDSRAERWNQVLEAAGRLVDQERQGGWGALAGVFAAAGHFRVVSVRSRDAGAHAYVLEHLSGLGEDAAARLRESRVPDPVLRDWMDPRSAFGPGFILRAKALPGDTANTPGSSLGPQDAWLIPFLSEEGRVEAYVSLAQPDPCRLPDADELRFYQAAFQAASRFISRQFREADTAHSVGQRIRESQMQAVAMSAFRDTLCSVAERLRSGLANLEGYAQALLDYGDAMPREEPQRVARVIVEESHDMREEALLIADLAELHSDDTRASGETVEFSDLYAELLQFLLHRAETRGVVLNGPPLQGGLYIDRPAALMQRLLALVSNELLSVCSKGHELTLSAWQGGSDVHIEWRANGAGIKAPGQDERTPRWVAAQAIAAALGGSLRESTFGADNRAVSLTIPLAGGSKEVETRVA